MNINIIFFSPRYIKYDCFGMLLSAIDIKKIYSFLPIDSLPYSSADAVRNYEYSEYDQKSDSNRKHDEFISSMAEEVISMASKSNVDDAPNTGKISNPTVLVMADWESDGTPYNLDLRQTGARFKRWTSMYDVFPYISHYGDITDQVVGAISNAASNSGQPNIVQRLRLKRLAVFFGVDPDLVETYNFSDRRWHCYTYVSKVTGKQISYVKLWRSRASKDNPDSLLYIGNDGKKKMRPVTLDVAKNDILRWKEYIRNEERERLEAEYFQQMYSDGYNSWDDNNDREQGCGEGWSCMNCPNVGCPANERN